VRRTHQKTLRATCNSKIADFARLGQPIENPDGQLVYIPRGGNILGVAHLDHVLKQPAKITKNVITCPQLDDRLGAWVLLHLLDEMDCPPFDILLTDCEEVGMSTARHFATDNDYNWIFSFDRAGNDVVLYDYEDDATSALVGEYFHVGHGSYSDICALEHLGVKGFNFGVGYHNQHTCECYANITDTIANAEVFCWFARDHHATHLRHVHVPVDPWGVEYDETYDCCECKAPLEDDWAYCPYCGTANYMCHVWQTSRRKELF